MKNRKYHLQRDFVLLTLSMFCIVSIWIVMNVYDTYVKTTIGDVLQIQLVPIDGKFDLDTIKQIKARTLIEPDYSLSSPSAAPVIIPTGLPVEVPVTVTPVSIENDIIQVPVLTVEPIVTEVVEP